MFFDEGEFPDFLEYFNGLPGSGMVLGDVNFHFNEPTKTYVAKMLSLLENFSFVQSVDQTTHKKGHIIDWIMHRPIDELVQSTQ